MLPAPFQWLELHLRTITSESQGKAQLRRVCVKSLSQVRLFATMWTVASQAPPSMGFSRQKYWSGLPFLPPGDLPTQDQTHVSYVSCIDRQILYHLQSH